MKKTNVELTAEELEAVVQLREKKAREEAAAREAEELKANVSKLEEKFREAMASADTEIESHLKIARSALAQAVAVSEKYGVPFRSDIVEMGRDRQYVPNSYSQKWENLDREVLEEFDLYIGRYHDTGWEYWSTSSLSC